MAMMIPLLYSLTVCMSFVGVDSLNVDTFIKGEFVEINIKNDGTNTVFLFDDYFDNSTLTSRYVHQYEKKSKSKYLSLLPMLPYLSKKQSDHVVIGKNRIVVQGNSFYHFTPIDPGEKYVLSIPINVFHQEEFVRRIDVREYSKYDSGIRFKCITNKRKAPFYVEIAVYHDISLLTDVEAYYLREKEFDEQARTYDILSIPVGYL